MSDRKNKIKVMRVCRICLTPEEYRQFNDFFDRRHDFAEKLYFLSSVKIFEIADKAPALICSQCEEDLTTAARVKRASLVADKFFKNIVDRSEEIKLLSDSEIKINLTDEMITEFKQEIDPHELAIPDNEDDFLNTQDLTASDDDSDENGEDLFNASAPETETMSHKSTRRERKHRESVEKRSYQKGGTKMGICNICGINLTTRERLLNHIRVRHDIVSENEMIPCPFEGCRKRFKIQLYVERHVANIHNRDKTATKEKEFWPCSICGIILGSKTALKQHEYRHSVPAQEKKSHSFFCDLCNFSSDKKIRVKYHIERIHLQLRKFKCKFCEQAFVHSSLLQYHELRIHLNLRKFACRYCDKSFTRSSCRLIHERIHTNERPYSCRFCERTFIHHSDYRRHELRHTGGIPIKQFQEQMKQGLVQYVN